MFPLILTRDHFASFLAFANLVAKILAAIMQASNHFSNGRSMSLNDAEMRGFFDALNQALTDVYTNVIQKPLEGALSSKSSEERVSQLSQYCYDIRRCLD